MRAIRSTIVIVGAVLCFSGGYTPVFGMAPTRLLRSLHQYCTQCPFLARTGVDAWLKLDPFPEECSLDYECKRTSVTAFIKDPEQYQEILKHANKANDVFLLNAIAVATFESRGEQKTRVLSLPDPMAGEKLLPSGDDFSNEEHAQKDNSRELEADLARLDGDFMRRIE